MVRASQALNQGLQVLLIVFVMLSVVLGVILYLKIKTADEEHKAALAAATAKTAADQATADKQKECDDLKKLIGFPERSTEEIKKQFGEDMTTYGNEKQSDADPGKPGADAPLFKADTLYYSRLLAGMNKVIQDRNDELIKARADYAVLDGKFKTRESHKDAAIAKITEDESDLTKEINKIKEEYTTGLQSTRDETKQLVQAVSRIKSGAASEVAAATHAADEAKKAAQQREVEVRTLAAERNKVERKEMDVPSGEITWVSLPNKVVWINRGRADALQRGTQFTVYSAESTIDAKAVKKGQVEVVRIEGDHMAQARILDDKLADPIMAGDKVFTPLWSPGQQNHFALAGIMNIDGDGRNQISVVRGLINQKGGVVDCELDEQGRKQGQITSDTRFIVVGDAPDKSSPEFMKTNGDILRDAERYHVQVLKLSDFKLQMNYQKTSSVEHFGGSVPTSNVSRAARSVPTGKPAPKAAPASDDSGK